MIAWSDGTKSALSLTVKYPDAVHKMVLFGVEVCNKDRGLNWLKSVVEMKTWGQTKIDCYKRGYDSDAEIQDLWRKYVRSCEYVKLYYGDDMFKDKYHLIKCPVLIVLGLKVSLLNVLTQIH